jgi:hypothetical protein
MAGTRAKALTDASSLWVLEATAVMQQSADKVRLLMVQTFILTVMYGAGVGRRGGQRQDVSGRKKALRSILALHPETALLTFCTGHWATSTRCSLMLPVLAAQMQNMEAGRWPKEALRFSFEGSRGVRPRWARTGAVMSNPLLSRSSTP